MSIWQLQAARNAAIDRGVAVSHPDFPDWTIYVRPAHNWNYHFSRAAARIAVSRPDIIGLFDRRARADYVPTPEDQELAAEVDVIAFAEGNIAGWDGVTDERGELLEYSQAAAVLLMQHFRQLYAYLKTFAETADNYPVLTDAAKAGIAAGNSKADCGSYSDHGASTGGRSQSATGGEKARRKR